MESFIGKKYKLDKSENFDEYMKALGVGMFLRKMVNSVSPTVELTVEDGNYTMTTASAFRTNAISFKLGEECDEDTLDGRKVKSVYTLDGNKLVQEQKCDKPVTILREFTDSELITTLSIGNVKSVRTYKAV